MNIFNPVIDDILKLVDDQVERVKVKMGGRSPKVWHRACYQPPQKEPKLTFHSIFSWSVVLVATDI